MEAYMLPTLMLQDKQAPQWYALQIARAAGKSRAKQTQLEADEVELLRDEELGARPVDFPVSTRVSSHRTS